MRDAAVGALERGDDRGQRVGRVVDHPAVHAGVEVDRRQLDVDLRVHDAAEADGDGRQVALEEPGVADDDHVGLEPVAVLGDPRLEARRAVFLLPFEHEGQVDRRRPADRAQGLEGAQVHHQLALVVRDAAADEPAVADERLERRVLPQVEGVDRLDVVVAVDDDGRRARRLVDPAVDDRMQVGRDDLDLGRAQAAQASRDPLRGRDHVAGVLVEGGHARDARQLEQGLDAGLARCHERGLDGGIDRSGLGGGAGLAHQAPGRSSRAGFDRSARREPAGRRPTDAGRTSS